MDIEVDSLTIVGFGTAAGATNGRHLGRFRRGDPVILDLETPVTPDAAPFVVVFDAKLDPVAEGSMAMHGAIPRRFRFILMPGIDLVPGAYSAFCGFYVSGEASVMGRRFDLVPGGDSGGAVIALHATDRPEGRAVVAQLASGRLALGRNPHI